MGKEMKKSTKIMKIVAGIIIIIVMGVGAMSGFNGGNAKTTDTQTRTSEQSPF
jgi:flagellar basal body-associated protein FliL